jgi:hypothetical protein
MVDAQTISIVFAGLSIGIAAIYYTLTLRNTQRAQQLQLETRQAQLFMNVYQEWISKDNLKDLHKCETMEWTDYDDFFTKYDPIENPDEHASWDKMFYYFNGLGQLVKQDLVNPESVVDLMGGTIIGLWEKFYPLIEEMRARYPSSNAAQNFEYLYNKMKELRERPDTMTPR